MTRYLLTCLTQSQMEIIKSFATLEEILTFLNASLYLNFSEIKIERLAVDYFHCVICKKDYSEAEKSNHLACYPPAENQSPSESEVDSILDFYSDVVFQR